MFVSSRKRNTLFFFNMFSSRQLRISFFKFLIGNDGSRLSFFLFRISSNASFFFVLWFFNLYKKLFFSLFFFSIKTDFVISFLISYNLCSVLPFILRFATIFSYCQSFFYVLIRYVLFHFQYSHTLSFNIEYLRICIIYVPIFFILSCILNYIGRMVGCYAF